jgi:Tfp pilus assembly protein FimT
MMVTVSVGAIMMAVPRLRTLVATNKITTEANRIVAGFNYARTEAVRRNQPVCSANLNTTSMSIAPALAQQTSSTTGVMDSWCMPTTSRTGTMGSYDSGEAIKSFSFYGEMNNASAINLVMSTSPVAVNQIAFGSDGRLLDGNRKLVLQDTSNNLCRVILVRLWPQQGL